MYVIFSSLQVAMGDGDYLSAFHQVILPVAREYNPQLVIVSCGFDSGRDDPIASSYSHARLSFPHCISEPHHFSYLPPLSSLYSL